MIIAAFAGTGKTYLGKKYKNVVDLEPAIFKWKFSNDINEIDEKVKGTKKQIRAEWPQNYVNKIIDLDKQYDFVLIGLNKDARELLEKMGHTYYLCFPDKNQKEKYLKRYIDRENPEEFIKKQEYYFDKELPMMYKESMPKMILEEEEFLEEYLLKNNYKLIPLNDDN